MLHLYLLGSLRLFDDDRPLDLAIPPKTLHLLAYLLLHRRAALTRDQLAFALWPDRTDADARGQLRRYLYRLRQFLPEGSWLIMHDEQVQWNTTAAYWLDVEEFERLSSGPLFTVLVAGATASRGAGAFILRRVPRPGGSR